MAIYNTPDGRQVVGSVESGNDYHGFNGKRDIIIQLTADGATTDGLNALEYLKAYAVEQNKQGKPIFPNGARVWISANGFTKAVEADDVVIDGENVTIGGIKWNGSAWDYTNAGQSGGGGLPPVTAADAGKVLAVDNSGVWGASELPTNRNSDTLIEIAAEYTNGSYVCNSTFDTNVFINKFLNGSDVRLHLTVNGETFQLYPTLLGSYLTIVYETYDPARKAKLRIDFAITDETTSVLISETDNRFIVTLTPTSADYSGTMDKTVAEINAAYEAGREIVYRFMVSESAYYDLATTVDYVGNHPYPEHFAMGVVDGAGLIVISANTDLAESTAYYTKVYTLTPAT